jgi:hypothetical protein
MSRYSSYSRGGGRTGSRLGRNKNYSNNPSATNTMTGIFLFCVASIIIVTVFTVIFA